MTYGVMVTCRTGAYDREAQIPVAEVALLELLEAQARLGEVLLQKADAAEFLRWNVALPKTAELHPRTWHARGMWAKRNGQPRAAVRCFLEALRLHPVHVSSNFQLSQTLLALGLSEAAEPFIERSRVLAKVEYTMSQLRDLNDVELMRQMCLCSRTVLGGKRILQANLLILIEGADFLLPDAPIHTLSDLDKGWKNMASRMGSRI